MGDFEHRHGKGYLFANKKEKESQPDYFGDFRIPEDVKAGDVINLSAWKGTTAKGKDMLSISHDTYVHPEQEPEPQDAFKQAHDAIDDEQSKNVPF